MKKLAFLLSLMSIVFIGCGGGGETKSFVASNNSNIGASDTTVSSDELVSTSGVRADKEYSLLYKLNSSNMGIRTIQRATENIAYEGVLRVVDKDGVATEFDWPSSINAENKIAIAEKTLVLKEGSYDMQLLLKNGDKQFVAKKSIVIDDSSQLELVFDLHSIIGDLLLTVNEVENLSKFVVSFSKTEIANFKEPVLGAVINGIEETFLNMNSSTGKVEGLLNLNVGDSVVFNFFDGATHKGRTETFTINDVDKEYTVDFTPLFGEVFFGTNSYEGNTTFRVNFAAGTLNSIDKEFDAIIKYINNEKYGEKIIELIQNADNSYTAETLFEGITHGSFNYTLSFIDKSNNTEFAKCVAEIPQLTSLDVSNDCTLLIENDTFINNNLLAVFGVNVYDYMGRGLEGFSIYLNNEFIGYTGGETFGTKGYLKSLAKKGEHVLKAQRSGVKYVKNVTIDSLSVNNYSFLSDETESNGSLESNISQENFIVVQGNQDSGVITLINNGNSDVSYNVDVQEIEVANENETISNKISLAKTTIFRSTDFNNRTITFDYVDEKGALVVGKTIKESELPSRVIVKYKESLLRNGIDAFEVKTVDNSNLTNFVNQIDSIESEGVEYIEPDIRVKMLGDTVPQDPQFLDQWALHNDGSKVGVEDVDTDWLEFFNVYTPTQKEVIVAVIDSGVDYTHPDIDDNIWINSEEIPNNGIDDDNNGYIDDVYGYDFHNGDNEPLDDHGHGTHIAGIIAAERNSIGIVGVNPYRTKIMTLKFLDQYGYGWFSNALKAIKYALAMGANISNNSWGSGQYMKSHADLLLQTVEKNHIFVAGGSFSSSGRDLDIKPDYPSCYDIPTVVSVSSSDYLDLLVEGANYGLENVDVLAPGQDIVSLWPGNSYKVLSGTSMATPFVTALASILYNKGEGDTPFQGILNTIFSSGDKTDTAQANTKYGTRINIANAYNGFKPSSEWFSIVKNKTGVVKSGEIIEIPFKVDLTYLKANATKAKKVVIENSSKEFTYEVTVDITQ